MLSNILYKISTLLGAFFPAFSTMLRLSIYRMIAEWQRSNRATPTITIRFSSFPLTPLLHPWTPLITSLLFVYYCVLFFTLSTILLQLTIAIADRYAVIRSRAYALRCAPRITSRSCVLLFGESRSLCFHPSSTKPSPG